MSSTHDDRLGHPGSPFAVAPFPEGGHPLRAAPARAEEVFSRVSCYRGEGLKNHCLRIAAFTGMLLQHRSVAMAPQLVHALSLMHDLGLLAPEVQGEDYLQRSRALFHRELPLTMFPRSAHEQRVADECLLYNHRLLPVPGLSAEAEAFRDAVWIEHTLGARRHGLDRGDVRAVFTRYPRADFDSVLLDFGRRVLAREPWTIVDGIFF